jgi:hypothetical protein
MSESPKKLRSTSLNVDKDFWKKWTIYTVNKTGSVKKVSDLTQEALEEYMQNHPMPQVNQ